MYLFRSRPGVGETQAVTALNRAWLTMDAMGLEVQSLLIGAAADITSAPTLFLTGYLMLWVVFGALAIGVNFWQSPRKNAGSKSA